jgi:hypothetical protein
LLKRKARPVAITERREIEFDLHALQLVLEWSPQAAQAFGLPPMVPTTVRCNPSDGHVEVTYGTLSAARMFALRAEALGAILISYCNRVGLPVPRGADKGVRIERDTVVLVFKLRIEHVAQPDSAEGPIGRAPEAVRAWAWNASEQ